MVVELLFVWFLIPTGKQKGYKWLKNMSLKLPLLLLFLLCFSQASSLPPLIKLTKPAVATIHVYNDWGEQVNQGSGFFIRPNLLVSTRHLFWKEQIRNATYARAMTNGFEKVDFHIENVLVDSPENDLILLGTEPFRPSEELSLSRLNLTLDIEEGEDVYVISSPLGLPGIISTGIISAIHNEWDIQISAAISEGSSGAPIFNYKGQVVGIVSGHFSQGQGMNFGLSAFALNALMGKAQGDLSRILNPLEIRPVLGTNLEPLALREWVEQQNILYEKEHARPPPTNVLSGLFRFFSDAWYSTREAILKYKPPVQSIGPPDAEPTLSKVDPIKAQNKAQPPTIVPSSTPTVSFGHVQKDNHNRHNDNENDTKLSTP